MEKVWLKHYQKGVPAEINPNEYHSLVHLFEESCRQNSHKIAYVNMGHEMSYAELEEKSRCFAIFLQRLGLAKGTRIALMMPNILQYPVALFGALRGGFIVVNTNPLYTADELGHQLQDSEAEVIVVLANFAHTVAKAVPTTSIKHIIITELGDLFAPVKRFAVNAVVKYLKKMIPAYDLPQAIPFNETMKSESTHVLAKPLLNHNDIAFLQYTGGTTGVAKGAMLTHGNMVANVLQAYYWIAPLNVGNQDIIVTALPLYHIFSLTANCLTFMKAGAKNILITNPRDLDHFIHDIKNAKFTAITGVNTLFNVLLNHPKINEVDFSHLKLALSGGMALQKSVALKWSEITHSRILEAYGLTETCPAVTINPMYAEDYNGSIGLPIPSTEISIRDEEGFELGFGETGELCIRGPQVMAGYWQRPDETALVMTEDGFLRTGDLAQIDDEGYIYLVDRKKDMIVVSGFNVYPNEVEQVISLHPGVLEVGVVGIPHEETGERVKACIVRKDPLLTEEDIIAHCRKHLTGYKVPRSIEFCAELPKTNVGKIMRRALKNPSGEAA